MLAIINCLSYAKGRIQNGIMIIKKKTARLKRHGSYSITPQKMFECRW